MWIKKMSGIYPSKPLECRICVVKVILIGKKENAYGVCVIEPLTTVLLRSFFCTCA
jgi:hypothetical protein